MGDFSLSTSRLQGKVSQHFTPFWPIQGDAIMLWYLGLHEWYHFMPVATWQRGDHVHLFLIVKCSKPVVVFVSCAEKYKAGEFNFWRESMNVRVKFRRFHGNKMKSSSSWNQRQSSDRNNGVRMHHRTDTTVILPQLPPPYCTSSLFSYALSLMV